MEDTIYKENHAEIIKEEYLDDNSLLKIKKNGDYYVASIQYVELGAIHESVLFRSKDLTEYYLDVSPDRKMVSVFSDQELIKLYNLEGHYLDAYDWETGLDLKYNHHYQNQVNENFQLIKRKKEL